MANDATRDGTALRRGSALRGGVTRKDVPLLRELSSRRDPVSLTAMTRDEAIAILTEHALAAMDADQRADMLVGWWGIDAGDPDYEALSEDARAELANPDAEGPGDSMAPHWEPLLRRALRTTFVGVINGYLEIRLAALGRAAAVDGEVEPLEACPCCGYRTIGERGGYEICQVCFWEDDGGNDLDAHSGPNHMTLREARDNFERLGAVTERELAFVLADGRARYARG